ncbi:Na+-translocating ferredoxin:NAD+ oxidoreductase RnfC subunit [Mobilisporobacter senegalensis]|uniref:Na+-translocating ferredoxin:NAD+ oxidoreductase RnfC subunit n=1 Tax=Mobilisporobacter senegalensis TaxID=1329262 RepID=A0A3N1XQZ5_9FIRM|nr:4Fe-4S dicluster domain-containing protein [Mobilisporobacter senegalensis]ROR29089.1 Na+-translocating ferredoxin:NAD+ oxidoreductase RnfC subunit [Mobilisporobacter senegalensis]
MDIKELTSIVKESGVAGAGGAGFPTYGKFDKRADTIILNCAECEPLLKVHRQLLQKFAYEIMSTLDMIATAVEANQIIIAVKSSYTLTVDAVKSYIDSFPKIIIKELEEVYPMGDEIVLIYETLGKVVPPGSIPIEAGVTVFNAETVYNIYKAVTDHEPVSSKYLTIAGAVNTPVTIKVPIGMTVKEVVDLAGGSVVDNPVYIMGGPMTGNIVNSYDTVTKTTNAILVLPKNQYVIQKRLSKTSINMKRAMSACCQCEMCTNLCPRNQLGHPIAPHMFMRAATSGVTKDLEPFLDTMFCSSCGLCEMYACPQELSPRRLIQDYKNGLRQNGIIMPKGYSLGEVESFREYRKIPMERLTSRLGLKAYNVEAPLTETEVIPKQVKILLNQHIGPKAEPVVNKKDMISKGDVIAAAEEGKLSLPIHASISGEILEVNDKYIIINS